MYRIIISTTLFALWSCAGTQGTVVTEAVTTGLTHGEYSNEAAAAAVDRRDVPVIDIASTAKLGRGVVCEDRPPPGSRIRNLRCYDEHAPKLSYDEFVALPDGLKPAASILHRR